MGGDEESGQGVCGRLIAEVSIVIVGARCLVTGWVRGVDSLEFKTFFVSLIAAEVEGRTHEVGLREAHLSQRGLERDGRWTTTLTRLLTLENSAFPDSAEIDTEAEAGASELKGMRYCLFGSYR